MSPSWQEEVNVRGEGKPRIERIFLRDADVKAAAGTCEAIEAADLITLGPGSLYTTVCVCLLVPEIARTISQARGLVVYVGNTTTQPGQTDEVTAVRPRRCRIRLPRRLGARRGPAEQRSAAEPSA